MSECNEPDHVEAAVWFHDVIYDTKTHDSEKRSADLARELLLKLGISRTTAEYVTSLILVTTHRVVPESADQTVIVDVDLAILGQPPDVFDQYERDIRIEYEWVEDEMFAQGRCRILRSFFDRPRIYGTHLFRARYENAARENLKRAIRRWEEFGCGFS